MFPAFLLYEVVNTWFQNIIFKGLHETILTRFRISLINMFIVKNNINCTILDHFVRVSRSSIKFCIIGRFQCHRFGKLAALIEQWNLK